MGPSGMGGGVLLLSLVVWVVIDAVMMFTGAVRDRNGRPLR